jgi:hypothetical protein
MFLGWSSAERGAQLRDLEILLMGYGHAIERHGIEEPGRTFLRSFSQFLHERYEWSKSLGPIAAIREHAKDDEQAWQLLWTLIREFRGTMTK